MTNQIKLEEALELVEFELCPEGWQVKQVRSSVWGHVWGSVRGSVGGDVQGNVRGDIGGNLYGTIGGRQWMFTERDLIQRMAKELDHYRQLLRDDCTSTHPFADEARAYLAQPKLEGPTDEEIFNLAQEHNISYSLIDGSVMRDDALSFARAVLSRWGK